MDCSAEKDFDNIIEVGEDAGILGTDSLKHLVAVVVAGIEIGSVDSNLAELLVVEPADFEWVAVENLFDFVAEIG